MATKKDKTQAPAATETDAVDPNIAAAAAAKAEQDKAVAAQAAADKAAKAEADKLAKEAKKAEDAAAKAEKKEADKLAREAKKEADKLAKEEQKAAAKAAKEASRMPIANDVRHPKPESLCGQAWTVFDEISAAKGGPTSIAEAMPVAIERKLNEGNVRAEYARWRKFYGVTGRVDAPKAAPAEPVAQ